MSGAKCRITLKIYIPVTDTKKLNDLHKSIATGAFYVHVHSKFDMLSSLVSGEMWNLNPLGYRPMQPWYGKFLEHQNRFAQRELMCEQVYEI